MAGTVDDVVAQGCCGCRIQKDYVVGRNAVLVVDAVGGYGAANAETIVPSVGQRATSGNGESTGRCVAHHDNVGITFKT